MSVVKRGAISRGKVHLDNEFPAYRELICDCSVNRIGIKSFVRLEREGALSDVWHIWHHFGVSG